MADAAPDRDAARAEFKRLVAGGMKPEQAMAQVRARRPPAAPAPAQKGAAPSVSRPESAIRGGVQGASMGFSDELAGVAATDPYATNPLAPDSYMWSQAPMTINEDQRRYREARDADRRENREAQEANPKTFLGGQIAGGMATAVVPGGAPATFGKAVATGAALGAASGLGGSDAELADGEFRKAAVDTAIGAGVGAAGGAVGVGLGKAFGAAAKKLQSYGQARLFKAAVGQNKRAFSQVNAKGLFEKSSEYLDSMGVGVGDSTESIGAKLAKRSEALDDDLGGLVSAMDEMAPSGVSPQMVAQRIEKEVAAPLKRLAANQGEYNQVMAAVEHIKQLGEELSFKEAAAQRRAFQQAINYDKVQGLDASAEAKRRIAQIWNDVIDEGAEPVLRKMGEHGDAYRELRHEYALVQEMLGHVNNRISGNQANRAISPSDYGTGGIAGIMTGNPFVGIAAAAANHLGRVYGNAAAGRGAINVARMAAGSERALRAFVPSAARALADKEHDKRAPVPAGVRKGSQ